MNFWILFRHVVLPTEVAKLLPKNRLLSEVSVDFEFNCLEKWEVGEERIQIHISRVWGYDIGCLEILLFYSKVWKFSKYYSVVQLYFFVCGWTRLINCWDYLLLKYLGLGHYLIMEILCSFSCNLVSMQYGLCSANSVMFLWVYIWCSSIWLKLHIHIWCRSLSI